MVKTLALVTNQYSCDRIIEAARGIAGQFHTELVVVGIQDSEYALNPQAIDYLFEASKRNSATMRLLFTDHKREPILETAARHEFRYIVTGMPSSHDSIVYDLWKQAPEKSYFVVDYDGEIVEVASAVQTVTA